MSTPLTERRRVARHRRSLAYWGVLLAWYCSLALGATLAPPEPLHSAMLFVHLASIIVGLGAAVVLEFNGLLWTAGRASLQELRQSEGTISTLAWLGILGLFFSGAFLEPDFDDPKTILKMLAVLLVAMNGVAMTKLTAELARLPGRTRFSALPSRVRLWCVWSAVVSQVGWWTAVLIGMLNSTG